MMLKIITLSTFHNQSCVAATNLVYWQPSIFYSKNISNEEFYQVMAFRYSLKSVNNKQQPARKKCNFKLL